MEDLPNVMVLPVNVFTKICIVATRKIRTRIVLEWMDCTYRGLDKGGKESVWDCGSKVAAVVIGQRVDSTEETVLLHSSYRKGIYQKQYF